MGRPLILCLLAGVLAAETAVSIDLAAVPLPEALGRLQALTDEDVLADAALVTAAPEVNLVLVGADRRARLQALAHAAGAWWLEGDEPRLTREDRLPCEAARARVATHQADLSRLPDAEAVVRAFMAPWLDPAVGGIGHDPATHRWSATLDPEGQSQLAALLPLMEQGRPAVPALLALPAPLPERTLPDKVTAVSWRTLVLALGKAAGVSVSVGPGVLVKDRRDTDAPPPIPAGDLAGACARLAEGGLRWDYRDGVLCVDVAAPEPRRHPARRRLLAVLPVGHLAPPDEVPALLERIRAEVIPGWWRHPAAGLTHLPAHDAIIVAADAPTMLALMDWVIAAEDAR